MENLMTNPTPIGFLGLGHMGASMAERLLAPDIRLYVYDTHQEAMEPFVKRGATASPRRLRWRTARRSSSPACRTRM